MDLTWYAEYKGTVDGILSAFILLWFVWRVFLSLPGIIAGTSGFWGDASFTGGIGITGRGLDPSQLSAPHSLMRRDD